MQPTITMISLTEGSSTEPSLRQNIHYINLQLRKKTINADEIEW